MKIVENSIVLRKAEAEHVESLRQFKLGEDQLAFTSMPIPTYEKCLADQEKFPVVILDNEKVIGFFVLDLGADVALYTTNPEAVLMRAFSINLEEQGKGFGKCSLHLLEPFVRENMPGRNEIVLGVNHNNPAAKQLYINAGFVDQGYKKEGRSGLMAILHNFI
ncbi:GNAT family protein [Pseudalkalibacillus hwajinpoensis]|uniref:GNAT family N-acetyltransferase n=1 Tax=Guptibacillus hwajinpoensis TaxID=208199 RepID=UPI00325C26AD